MIKQFKGTGVALVTPFQKNGSIDFIALQKLVNHVIEGGVDFIVALGTTAETVTLTNEEKHEVLTSIITFTNNRVPIVCGIGGNNTTEVVHQIKTNNLNGVSALLSVAPYYNKPSQEGMYQHFKAIAEASNLPIILYNVPGRTSSNLLPATVLRLALDFTNIIGIKEASGNMVQCMEILIQKPDNFIVLSGDDNLIVPQMAIGMDGIISVAANCYTKQMTEIINLLLIEKYSEAKKLFYNLLPGIDLLFVEGNPAGVKCALSYLDICENVFRLPIVPVSKNTDEKTKLFIASSNLLGN